MMRRSLGCFGVVVVCCLLLACLGMGYPADLLFNLVVGWAFYCYRVLPQVRPSGAGILTALICLGALAFGTHAFLRWFYGQLPASGQVGGGITRSWPARRTRILLAVILLMFVAGLSAVGVSHQTAWLLTSPEPLLDGGMHNVAARMQSQNNLKQMVLAMYIYLDENRVLPPAAIWEGSGQPLLSWRVLILPYVEEEALFKAFHLNEPWDSPHNLRLLPRMPKIYAAVSTNKSPNPYGTCYRVFTGKGTAFEGRRGLRLPDDFPDGTANTILIVEAAETVPWTKPEDLLYYPSEPLPALSRTAE
jgi:hypothetical protein